MIPSFGNGLFRPITLTLTLLFFDILIPSLPLEKQRTSALLCICTPASTGVDASSCEAVKRGWPGMWSVEQNLTHWLLFWGADARLLWRWRPDYACVCVFLKCTWLGLYDPMIAFRSTWLQTPHPWVGLLCFTASITCFCVGAEDFFKYCQSQCGQMQYPHLWSCSVW